MKTKSIRLAAILTVALSGCYAQLEENSIVISHPLAVPGAPAGGSVTVPSVNFEVGDVEVDAGDKESKLSLSTATLTAGSATLGGITSATLTIAPPDGSTLEPVTLTYDKNRDGAAGATLVLKRGAEEANLLPYLASKRLQLAIELAGDAPSTSWTADLDLDFHLLGKVKIP